MKRIWIKLKTYISPFLNWRILIIYLPIWFITSGWAYLFIFLGSKYNVGWMLTVGTIWTTILWLPFTPEKLITIPLTLYLYVKLLKGGDVNYKLEHMLAEARKDWYNTRRWLRRCWYNTRRGWLRCWNNTRRWWLRCWNNTRWRWIIVTITIITLILGILIGLNQATVWDVIGLNQATI